MPHLRMAPSTLTSLPGIAPAHLHTTRRAKGSVQPSSGLQSHVVSKDKSALEFLDFQGKHLLYFIGLVVLKIASC